MHHFTMTLPTDVRNRKTRHAPSLNPTDSEKAKEYSYSTLVFAPENSQMIRVESLWDSETGRWVSTFRWMWLRVTGFNFSWLDGDPVGREPKNPWVRRDSNTQMRGQIPAAHDDAVKHISNIMSRRNEILPFPTYSGKGIPALFAGRSNSETYKAEEDPLLKPAVMENVPQGIQVLQMTTEDLMAIMNNHKLKTETFFSS